MHRSDFVVPLSTLYELILCRTKQCIPAQSEYKFCSFRVWRLKQKGTKFKKDEKSGRKLRWSARKITEQRFGENKKWCSLKVCGLRKEIRGKFLSLSVKLFSNLHAIFVVESSSCCMECNLLFFKKIVIGFKVGVAWNWW